MQESFTWVRRSAEQGYAQAELLLARFYLLGLAVDRDHEQGFRWAKQAADQGNPDAMALLGLNHEFGEGTPRDAQKAIEWLRRAEKAGSRVAPKWMGDFYSRGEARTARRTNYVEALRCYERAASNGLVSAGVIVANMCSKGLGTVPDSARALYWLRRFAGEGSPDALERLAAVYAEGTAEARGPDDTATELIRRAAVTHAAQFESAGEQTWAFNPSLDLIPDCQELWNRYRFGIGTPRDYIAAVQWMWQAYREDLRRVANAKGLTTRDQNPLHPFDSYLKGEVPVLTTDERLWQDAVRIMHKALDENRAEAWDQIGEYYRDGGRLTPKNPVLAWAWLNRAANLGYAPSRNAVEAIEKVLTTSEIRAAQNIWLPRPIERRH